MYSPSKLRTSIGRVLNQQSAWSGFDDRKNFTFNEIATLLETSYGEKHLLAYNEELNAAPSDVNGLIESGYPQRYLTFWKPGR